MNFRLVLNRDSFSFDFNLSFPYLRFIIRSFVSVISFQIQIGFHLFRSVSFCSLRFFFGVDLGSQSDGHLCSFGDRHRIFTRFVFKPDFIIFTYPSLGHYFRIHFHLSNRISLFAPPPTFVRGRSSSRFLFRFTSHRSNAHPNLPSRSSFACRQFHRSCVHPFIFVTHSLASHPRLYARSGHVRSFSASRLTLVP